MIRTLDQRFYADRRKNMEAVSYIRVTFDDGSYNELYTDDYQEIVDCMWAWARDERDSIFSTLDIRGGRVAFYVSKVQDIFECTPETRAKHVELEEQMKDERRGLTGDWE